MPADVMVLGAGVVGTSIAVHLAERGHSVLLVDRRGAGEETSYGNAGLIQTEGVLPYTFPRDLGKLIDYGFNQRTDMHYHPLTLPRLAGFLSRYWWNSAPKRYEHVVAAYAPFILTAVAEHNRLIEAAGAADLIVKEGWYRLFRSDATRDAAWREAEAVRDRFGVGHEQLSPAEMQAREPGLGGVIAGGLHWTDPWSIKDPGGLVKRYRDHFVRLGGEVVTADALTLSQKGTGWTLAVPGGTLSAAQAVVAMGPWSGDLASRLGYNLPLGVKRGYHLHYAQPETQKLTSWVHDTDRGYMLCPMNQGIRLTTGVEFADRDAPSSPVQLGRAERSARELFPGLGAPVETSPWRGARPCTPDMMPVIGPAPDHKGLWFAFGHAHHGMTLGPATGRLIAEMLAGETTYVDARAFGVERLLR